MHSWFVPRSQVNTQRRARRDNQGTTSDDCGRMDHSATACSSNGHERAKAKRRVASARQGRRERGKRDAKHVRAGLSPSPSPSPPYCSVPRAIARNGDDITSTVQGCCDGYELSDFLGVAAHAESTYPQRRPLTLSKLTLTTGPWFFLRLEPVGDESFGCISSSPHSGGRSLQQPPKPARPRCWVVLFRGGPRLESRVPSPDQDQSQHIGTRDRIEVWGHGFGVLCVISRAPRAPRAPRTTRQCGLSRVGIIGML
jgi:hypothetical protein